MKIMNALLVFFVPVFLGSIVLTTTATEFSQPEAKALDYFPWIELPAEIRQLVIKEILQEENPWRVQENVVRLMQTSYQFKALFDNQDYIKPLIAALKMRGVGKRAYMIFPIWPRQNFFLMQ